MSIFGSLFRNKIGMQPKSESLNRHIGVYQKIIDDKNTMEAKALEDLKNTQQWNGYLFEKMQVDNLSKSSNITYEEWVSLNNALEDFKDKIISDFIDCQSDDTIYGILRNGLNMLKKKNINLLNMSKMQFDYWQNVVDSAELAELTITQIINSSDYKTATNNDKLIQDYQTRRHFRK